LVRSNGPARAEGNTQDKAYDPAIRVMSPWKLNTGVLFRGPRHAFTRNPPARLHVCSAFTWTTLIVGRKPNHCKPAKRNKSATCNQPFNDHSAKLIASQTKANIYPALGAGWDETQIPISGQVEFNGYPSRDQGSYRNFLLPLAVTLAYLSNGP
jgi:hypothetical protein